MKLRCIVVSGLLAFGIFASTASGATINNLAYYLAGYLSGAKFGSVKNVGCIPFKTGYLCKANVVTVKKAQICFFGIFDHAGQMAGVEQINCTTNKPTKTKKPAVKKTKGAPAA